MSFVCLGQDGDHTAYGSTTLRGREFCADPDFRVSDEAGEEFLHSTIVPKFHGSPTSTGESARRRSIGDVQFGIGFREFAERRR